MLKLLMELITYDDFAKVEFRVGEILEAKAVEKSEKLIRMVVDFGEDFGKKIARGTNLTLFFNIPDRSIVPGMSRFLFDRYLSLCL